MTLPTSLVTNVAGQGDLSSVVSLGPATSATWTTRPDDGSLRPRLVYGRAVSGGAVDLCFQERARPPMTSNGQQIIGQLYVNPANVALTYAGSPSWSDAAIDRLCDALGVPVGLGYNATPNQWADRLTGYAVEDKIAQLRSILATAPPRHLPVLLEGFGIRYLPSVTISTLLRKMIPGSLNYHPLLQLRLVNSWVEVSYFGFAYALTGQANLWEDRSLYDFGIMNTACPQVVMSIPGLPASQLHAAELGYGGPGWIPTGYQVLAHAHLWGARVDADGWVTRLYAKATSHQLASAWVGNPRLKTTDELYRLGLKLQGQAPFTLDVTLMDYEQPPDLYQWPEALAHGFTPGEIAERQFANISGAKLRDFIFDAKPSNLFVAATSANDSQQQVSWTVDIAEDLTVTRVSDGVVLTPSKIAGQTVKPSLTARNVGGTRLATVGAAERLLGVSILDEATPALALDPSEHAGMADAGHRWVGHCLLPRAVQSLGIAAMFGALQSRFTFNQRS